MDPVTATLLANLLITLMANSPQIIAAIENIDAPEEDKAALIARIKAAQVSLPIWE